MKNRKLLTVIVPTYNRASSLSILLGVLAKELVGLEQQVDVIIGDNASTDNTNEIIENFRGSYNAAILLKHPENVGADENFCRCVERVKSKYFWIIGDDDLPRAGLLQHLINFLELNNPDLVYLNSDWRNMLTAQDSDEPVGELTAVKYDAISFARNIHVWTTFISGNVVNLDTYLASNELSSLRRFNGTNLGQLEWVLGNLKTGREFAVIQEQCVLATAGNSGGYSLLQVFGVNFSRISNKTFGDQSSISKCLIRRNLICYLPTLIWKIRFNNNLGAFKAEPIINPLKQELDKFAIFWIVIVPISILPKWPSWVFAKLVSAVAKSLHFVDKMRTNSIQTIS